MPVAGKVVVSFAGYHSILPVVFGRFFKKPVFVILHGNDAASIPSLDYGNFRKWPLSWCTAFSVKNATKLLPVSKHLINTKLKGPARKMEANQGVAAFVKNPAHHEVIHNGLSLIHI